MMVNKIIINLLFFIPFLCQCQSTQYVRINTLSGQETLSINEYNYTYEYRWFRYYDVGPIEDTIYHTGTYKKEGDTLILNSKNSPNNYDNIVFKKEGTKKSDSTQIIITVIDSTMFFLIAPRQIRINDIYYPLPKIKKNKIEFSLPKFQIKYIIIPGYPIYMVKNKNSNYFRFTITELSGTEFEYPGNTFFYNEKFLIQKNLIYKLRNNQIANNYIFERK